MPSLPPPSGSVQKLKVWLQDNRRTVWRACSYRPTYTLRELHGVIYAAMGWEGIHRS
ncbi:MAG: IS1096 element passenger TnpR family protein [Vulcanimicrobiaceae bacterium]